MMPLLLTATLLVPANDTFAQAEEEYRAGLESREDSAKARRHFARSADAFEQLWQQGERTAELARNLAQSRYLSGDIGRAIRDYRRGLNLTPYDAELQQGLDFVRKQVNANEATTSSRVQQSGIAIGRTGMPLPRIFLSILVIAAMGWLLLARAWLTARGSLAIVAGAIVIASIAMGAALHWEDRRVREQWATPTAVTFSPSEIFMGNSEDYPRRIDAKIPPGVEMRILGERGGWLHVELADGTIGWIKQSRVATTD